ncbi:histidine ammonia-lyase [Paenibacillus glycanilyticus]|uniref:Histidine ammonia-lyase n=1 Tax=Paenibacillus glycanilyticus TaxID=126569 RepID=A0ABQ6NKG0_9BACL|nr:aromatic amino acid ammonia-lyase [Paenibacillus glycanilyticus]GMK44657.1 histidine ammonia-lyase [Paenibacillus glycanilyticus]
MSDILRLDGSSLSIADVYEVAYGGRKIEIAAPAWERVNAARRLIFELADRDVPVYGLNRGVGWNKDKTIEAVFFEQFNRNLIRSHSAGIAPYASEPEVRAVLLARLNTLLVGCSGADPSIVLRYAECLNRRVHPVLPLRGSVGAADITTLSHIGLAFIGEGEADYEGRRLPALEALSAAGLTPLTLGPRDGLAIVSSNAHAAGTGALVLHEIGELLELADIVYALSLEGLSGNVSPLEEGVHRVRPYPGQLRSVAVVRSALQDSDIWQHYNPESLQDPLSFRDACHIHGAAYDALGYTAEQLEIQLNGSDDNPCVLVDEGRIISCANFEAVSWTLGFEMLGSALHHVSRAACYRIIKLGTPSFTGLSRFLTPNEASSIGYCTAQKTATSLDAEIRHLSNPASADYIALAGEIEDHAANSPFVVAKTREILDRLRWIIGIEVLHAAQAVDLRNAASGKSVLGRGTRSIHAALRKQVPFLAEDRNISKDIETAYAMIKNGEMLEAAREAFATSL